MRISPSLWLIIFAAPPMAAQDPQRQLAINPAGCYQAAPALTYSAFGQPERGDTSWALVRLATDQTVRRPLLRGDRDRNSKWSLRGDTLVVLVHDGLVGWRLALTATDVGWQGRGRYLTDVLGGEPIVREFTLKPLPC